MHLTICFDVSVGSIQRMFSKWSSVWFYIYQFLVYQCHLKCMGRKFSVRTLEATIIVHVIVYTNKLTCKSFQNIKVAPGFWSQVVKVNFHHNLINVIKEFSGKIFKSKILSSFSIHLENNMLFYKISAFKNVPKSKEHILRSLLRNLSDTNSAEDIKIIPISTWRSSRYCAIVLIVGYHEHRHHITSKSIICLDSKVQKCLSFLKKIFAQNISSVSLSSNSYKFAVSILSKKSSTL